MCREHLLWVATDTGTMRENGGEDDVLLLLGIEEVRCTRSPGLQRTLQNKERNRKWSHKHSVWNVNKSCEGGISLSATPDQIYTSSLCALFHCNWHFRIVWVFLLFLWRGRGRWPCRDPLADKQTHLIKVPASCSDYTH